MTGLKVLVAALVLAVVVSAAPVLRHDRPVSALSNGERLQQYIVVFAPNVTIGRDAFLATRLPSYRLFTTRQVGQHEYNSTHFAGFSAMLTSSELAILAASDEVAYIEEDTVIDLPRTITPTSNDIDVPTWGCDRADQRALPLNKIYNLPITKEESVAIPNVYVVDTGVNTQHVEFEGRASIAKNFFDDGEEDCNGHGTHVSGTVAGNRTGIAPFANILGVRIFDCRGTTTAAIVIAGIDFVTQNHTKPAVMTMSIGGGFFKAINDATSAAIAAGIPTTVASGNEKQDACKVSPASTPGAITVNSMNKLDRSSSFSNFGPCTVVYAPGEAVVSTWFTGPTAYKSLDGTSMATPHVAGYAALFLARKPNATPKEVYDAVVCAATLDTITNVPAKTPNRLFFVEKEAMEKCLP